MDKICEIKSILEAQAYSQMGNLKDVDTKELSEVICMIEKLAEAAYYCKATEAMEGAGEELEQYDRMGYNTSRYKNGHYAPSGRGHYSNTGHTMGFRPMEMEYMSDYVNDPVRFREDMQNLRMGYHDQDIAERNRHGSAYADWNMARRHYTETHDARDKAEMSTHANEHIADIMVTVKDMWKEADPGLQMEMKNKLQSLLNEMK